MKYIDIIGSISPCGGASLTGRRSLVGRHRGKGRKFIWNWILCFDECFDESILFHRIGIKSLISHYIISPRQQANLCLCTRLLSFTSYAHLSFVCRRRSTMKNYLTHTQPPNALCNRFFSLLVTIYYRILDGSD